MQAARSLDDAAELLDVEAERSLLELLLHDAAAKAAQIAELVGAVAVGLALGQVGERDLARADAALVVLQDGAGLVL